jgi:hypothetical protein
MNHENYFPFVYFVIFVVKILFIHSNKKTRRKPTQSNRFPAMIKNACVTQIPAN